MSKTKKLAENSLALALVLVLLIGSFFTVSGVLHSKAASYPTVTSCKGLTVKQSENNWYTYNAKNKRVIYTGVASNSLGWWRIENGKVNFKATGLYQNDYGWWYVQNGKVDFNANSIYSNAYGWWKVSGGTVTFKENGVFQNAYGWWKVENSKVNFNFYGVASNQYGDWWIEDGKVNFNRNGIRVYNGKNYQITNGKATKADQLARKAEAVQVVKDSTVTAHASRQMYIDIMTDESSHDENVFTKEEAIYAVDNAGVNWNQQAELVSIDIIIDDNGPTGVSRDMLKLSLEQAKFTDANINAALSAVESAIKNDYGSTSNFWNQSAVKAAEEYVAEYKKENKNKSPSKSNVKEVLKSGYLFTDAQATYGSNNVKL